jgi:hypothetical protein
LPIELIKVKVEIEHPGQESPQRPSIADFGGGMPVNRQGINQTARGARNLYENRHFSQHQGTDEILVGKTVNRFEPAATIELK